MAQICMRKIKIAVELCRCLFKSQAWLPTSMIKSMPMLIDTTPCSQLSAQRDHSRLSCHHVCKRPSRCPDAVCHETISEDGILSYTSRACTNVAKSFCLAKRAFTALKYCWDYVAKMRPEPHKLPMRWAIRQPCDHHEIVLQIKLHIYKGKIQVKVDYLPSFLHHGCFEHLPWDTFEQTQGRQVNSFIILRQLVNASCKPTLSPGVNSWSQQIANPGSPRGQASASTQKPDPKG